LDKEDNEESGLLWSYAVDVDVDTIDCVYLSFNSSIHSGRFRSGDGARRRRAGRKTSNNDKLIHFDKEYNKETRELSFEPGEEQVQLSSDGESEYK
jgi:hypothetical protein